MDIAKIVKYLEANFTALMVTTVEHPRFSALLKQSLSGGDDTGQANRVVEWTYSRGLDDFPNESKPPQGALRIMAEVADRMNQESRAIEEALEHGLTPPRRQVQPTVFLLKDFQPYLKMPEICEGMFDLAMSAQSEPMWVVITTPRTDVPLELQDTITVVEFDLPDQSYLSTLVTNFSSQLDVGIDEDMTRQAADTLAGLTDAQASNALALTWTETGEIHLGAMLQEKARALTQTGEGIEVVDTTDNLSLEEMGGVEVLSDWLVSRLNALTDPKAREFGLDVPRGPLLVGPPGCGKSCVCKAAGKIRNLPVMFVNIGELFGSGVGESEGNMSRLLRTIKAAAPIIVVFDEMEKGTSMSMGSNSGDSGTSARMMGMLLTAMQEMQEPAFLIGTVNDVTAMRAEMTRKGRWGEIFLLDLPGQKARKKIIRTHLTRRGRDPETFQLGELMDASEGFSGSELESAIVSALYDAYDDGKRELTTADVLKSLEETMPLSKAGGSDMEHMREWAAKRARPAGSEGTRRKKKRKPKDRFEQIRT